mmetsp:Transcript_24601/g.72127  ORF Transcript_24601/g.72127 Transcript_24601/m.72127 type:complete len:230 (+) Transcript_24601:1190-1879(+)
MQQPRPLPLLPPPPRMVARSLLARHGMHLLHACWTWCPCTCSPHHRSQLLSSVQSWPRMPRARSTPNTNSWCSRAISPGQCSDDTANLLASTNPCRKHYRSGGWSTSPFFLACQRRNLSGISMMDTSNTAKKFWTSTSRVFCPRPRRLRMSTCFHSSDSCLSPACLRSPLLHLPPTLLTEVVLPAPSRVPLSTSQGCETPQVLATWSYSAATIPYPRSSEQPPELSGTT